MSISYRKKDGTLSDVLLAGTPKTDLILDGTSSNAIANRTVYNALAQKIEATIENLVNFYNKSQVFNKQEVRELIGAINTLTIEVVNSLPTSDISATTIYFLKQSGANAYDEYIYVDNAWVKIGDTEIDLSGYMTTANFNIAIADYYNKTAIDTMIANYYTKTEVENLLENVEIDVDDTLSTTSENPVQNKVITNALNNKANKIFQGTTAQWDALTTAQKKEYETCILTDDDDYVGNIVNTVTDGEMSAVTSNAVYNALTWTEIYNSSGGQFKIYHRYGEIAITTAGYNVVQSKIGNIAELTLISVPLPKTFVSVGASRGNILGVDTSGRVTLYSETLAAYETGTVYGTIVYPCDET